MTERAPISLTKEELRKQCIASNDCSISECIPFCDNVQWFGNTSKCTVAMQHKLPGSQIWDTLGEFGPGQSVDLGTAALWYPRGTVFRALAFSADGSKVELTKDFGTGNPTMLITSDDCDPAKLQSAFATPAVTAGQGVPNDLQFGIKIQNQAQVQTTETFGFALTITLGVIAGIIVFATLILVLQISHTRTSY